MSKQPSSMRLDVDTPSVLGTWLLSTFAMYGKRVNIGAISFIDIENRIPTNLWFGELLDFLSEGLTKDQHREVLVRKPGCATFLIRNGAAFYIVRYKPTTLHARMCAVVVSSPGRPDFPYATYTQKAGWDTVEDIARGNCIWEVFSKWFPSDYRANQDPVSVTVSPGNATTMIECVLSCKETDPETHAYIEQ